MHAAEAPAEGQADSMAAATTTTRRSRAKPNSACNFCVKRKIACDAAKPQCAQCVKRGRICTYEPRARGEEEARDAERPAGSLSRQQQVMALYAQARAANTRQHSVDPGRTLIYDRQGGSAETLKSRTPSDGSSDFSGAVATSRIVIGRPLTTPTHEILPDPDTMLGLYSTYRNSIGSSVFFDWLGTVEENSPLLRLSIACVSARAVPNSEDVCRRLFRRTRLALEPTLAGAVEPTVDVCRALMNLIAFLGLSEDFAELLAAQQLLKLLSGFIKSMGIMNEANHVNTRGYGGTVVASHDMAERRMLFWSLYSMEQNMAILALQPVAVTEQDIYVGIPIIEEGGGTAPTTLDLFKGQLGPLIISPHVRAIFFHYIVGRMVTLADTAHFWNVTNGGTSVLPADIVAEQNWILSAMERYREAEVKYGTTTIPLPGDEIIVQERMANILPGGPTAYRLLVPILKRSAKDLVVYCMSALVLAPRHDLFGFIMSGAQQSVTPGDMGSVPPSEVLAAVSRLQAWVRLESTSLEDLVLAGHDVQEAAIAIQAVTKAYSHVASAARCLEQLTPFSEWISYVRPICVWGVWVAGMLDMIRYLFAPPPLDTDSSDRIHIFTAWFDQPAIQRGWPVFRAFARAYLLSYQAAVAFKAQMHAAMMAAMAAAARQEREVLAL